MWAKQTVHAVLERCVVEVKNKDKEESHNTSTVNPIKLPDLDKLCPEDCNDHGTCNNGMTFYFDILFICVYVITVMIIKVMKNVVYNYLFFYIFLFTDINLNFNLF